MDFNLLLREAGIAPEQVLLMRHRPWEPKLARILPMLVENPVLFEAYQQYQGPRVEASLLKKTYLASFIADGPGRALFVGIYRINGHTERTVAQFWEEPHNQQLKTLGYEGYTADRFKPTDRVRRFDLPHHETALSRWAGKLVVGWSSERSWCQHAGPAGRCPVIAIHEERAVAGPLPDPGELVLRWPELQVLSPSWAAGLRQWRGIYLIFDAASGLRYVGSATGKDNMLSRWRDYAASGDGGNKLLKGRDPAHFIFSVLQLTAQDLPAADVVQLEASWKNRLHSRYPHGLNEN